MNFNSSDESIINFGAEQSLTLRDRRLLSEKSYAGVKKTTNYSTFTSLNKEQTNPLQMYSGISTFSK